MAISDNKRQSQYRLPGGMGCIGFLLVGILLAVTVAMTQNSGDTVQANRPLSEPEQVIQLPTVGGIATMTVVPPTETPTPTDPATYTPKPSATAKSLATQSVGVIESAVTVATPAADQLDDMVARSADIEEEANPWPTNTVVPPPLPTPRGTVSYTLKVPILMYHYVSDPPDDADKYRRDLSVSPADFRQQMAYLAENGFETVDLYDLSLAISDKIKLPPKPIIITLDDGYRDNYLNAFPILDQYGLEATIFLVTEQLDQGNELYLDWAMVQEMSIAGHRFEPHSKTHPDLTIHDRDHIIWQVQGSRETIAAHIGTMPRFFAYPSGRFNEEVQMILAEFDFWGAVTTLGGKWHGFGDRYEWTRMRVRDVTTLEDFISMIE